MDRGRGCDTDTPKDGQEQRQSGRERDGRRDRHRGGNGQTDGWKDRHTDRDRTDPAAESRTKVRRDRKLWKESPVQRRMHRRREGAVREPGRTQSPHPPTPPTRSGDQGRAGGRGGQAALAGPSLSPTLLLMPRASGLARAGPKVTEINETGPCPVSKGPAKGTLLPCLPLKTCEGAGKLKKQASEHLKHQNAREPGWGEDPLAAG